MITLLDHVLRLSKMRKSKGVEITITGFVVVERESDNEFLHFEKCEGKDTKIRVVDDSIIKPGQEYLSPGQKIKIVCSNNEIIRIEKDV